MKTPEEYAKQALSRCHDCDGWDADKLNRHVTKIIRQAILDEREACAQTCDEMRYKFAGTLVGNVVAVCEAADAIRNRK